MLVTDVNRLWKFLQLRYCKTMSFLENRPSLCCQMLPTPNLNKYYYYKYFCIFAKLSKPTNRATVLKTRGAFVVKMCEAM